MYNGFLNIRKEAGFTSNDAVAKLRGILRQKRIGHTGTLDPDAEGVLPVCLGNATKASAFLTDTDKEYRCILLLGIVTDTQDISGIVKQQRAVDVTEEETREAVLSFAGGYEQIPPMYSAKKIGGKKLYELARSGIEVERKAVHVKIHEIRTDDISLPEVTVTVRCSKGTYIRTLCQDIGEKLGCGGCMKKLVRTKAGPFTLDHSLSLEEVKCLAREGRLEEYILPVAEVFSAFPCLQTTEEADRFLKNGNELRPDNFRDTRSFIPGCRYRICFSDGIFAAVYQAKDTDRLAAVRMFLP